VPKLGVGTSFTAEAEQPAPAIPGEDLTQLLKVPVAGPAETPKHDAETKEKEAKEPEPELPKISSPPAEAELPKVAKAPATTPKRRRMASVLDAFMESTRVLTPAPTKKVVEAATACAETEARPSVPAESEPAATEQRAEQESPYADVALEKKDAPEKAKSPILEASSEDLDFIIRHASRKRLSEEEIVEAKHYARELKYPKGALVYNGTDKDDFPYFLPDNKEISVCQEMAKNIGFPKLEAGLSAMSKDDLADSLAYNSLKVRKL
jgi:chemotaxis protein histidine kinase CheA